MLSQSTRRVMRVNSRCRSESTLLWAAPSGSASPRAAAASRNSS